MDADGNKLSKSGDAPGLDGAPPATQLVAVLEVLRQDPPGGLSEAGLDEIWGWALGHWRPERFRSLMKINANKPRTGATGQEPVDDEQA